MQIDRPSTLELPWDASLQLQSVILLFPVAAGEAQKIDRIMERFAERYCKDNPEAFKTSDGAYLLSFALIMLNTDAHNPMADKKLSLEDFISMCQYQVLLSYPWHLVLLRSHSVFIRGTRLAVTCIHGSNFGHSS